MAKKTDKIESYQLKLASLADIARAASTFGEGATALYAYKEGSLYRVLLPSIKLGDLKLIFYAEAKSIANYLVYKYPTSSRKESAELTDDAPPALQDQSVQHMAVVELMKSPFVETDGDMKVVNVELKDYKALIKGTLLQALEHGGIGRIYSFGQGKDSYWGSFRVMDMHFSDDEDKRIFCYAKIGKEKPAAFFRYNYNEDKIEATEIFGEHSFLYVRVIGLANAPKFFKLD